MMRSRFRRTTERVFLVDLTVHQLDSIPALHRLLYVHWRARRAIPSEGRTPSLAVEPGNVVPWNDSTRFSITIPSEQGDASVLQPAPLTLQLRSERRSRWLGTATFQAEGVVNVDISEVAAVGYVSRNYLVQDSLLNTTLKLSIRVTHQSGDRIFRARTLAAASSQDPSETPGDSDSAGTLPPVASRDPFGTEARIERTASGYGPGVSVPTALGSAPALVPLPSASRVSGFTSIPVASTSTPGLYATTEGDAASSAFLPHQADPSPHIVLENSIPNPDLVQRHVYEQMFQERVRDGWPVHIEASRVDATEAVNSVYAAVCAADGIGVAGGASSDLPKNVPDLLGATRTDKTLSLEALLESRNGAPPPSTKSVSQVPLPRKTSGRSPHLSVRSSSMGEISELSKLTA